MREYEAKSPEELRLEDYLGRFGRIMGWSFTFEGGFGVGDVASSPSNFGDEADKAKAEAKEKETGEGKDKKTAEAEVEKSKDPKKSEDGGGGNSA